MPPAMSSSHCRFVRQRAVLVQLRVRGFRLGCSADLEVLLVHSRYASRETRLY